MSECDANRILGENVKRLREKCGFSQSQVAEYLDIEQSTVNDIETGTEKLSAVDLLALTNFFCADFRDFFTVYDKEQDPQLAS